MDRIVSIIERVQRRNPGRFGAYYREDEKVGLGGGCTLEGRDGLGAGEGRLGWSGRWQGQRRCACAALQTRWAGQPLLPAAVSVHGLHTCFHVAVRIALQGRVRPVLDSDGADTDFDRCVCVRVRVCVRVCVCVCVCVCVWVCCRGLLERAQAGTPRPFAGMPHAPWRHRPSTHTSPLTLPTVYHFLN